MLLLSMFRFACLFISDAVWPFEVSFLLLHSTNLSHSLSVHRHLLYYFLPITFMVKALFVNWVIFVHILMSIYSSTLDMNRPVMTWRRRKAEKSTKFDLPWAHPHISRCSSNNSNITPISPPTPDPATKAPSNPVRVSMNPCNAFERPHLRRPEKAIPQPHPCQWSSRRRGPRGRRRPNNSNNNRRLKPWRSQSKNRERWLRAIRKNPITSNK